MPVKQEGPAHISCFVASREEAIVIKPCRDVSVYVELAMKTRSRITMIPEKNRNKDYVIGSIELKRYFSNTLIGHSDQTRLNYRNMDFNDEDLLKIGQRKRDMGPLVELKHFGAYNNLACEAD